MKKSFQLPIEINLTRVTNKFAKRISRLRIFAQVEISRHIRDRTLRLSSLCLCSLSPLIYPISF